MKMKSYFAATVEGALNMARQELGPDAMLVDSRKTGKDSRHLGEYEVVCAGFASSPSSPSIADGADQPGPREYASPHIDKLSHEVSELKRYMERMAMSIARSNTGYANLRSNPELAEAFAYLTASDVEPALAHDIVKLVSERADDDQSLPALLHSEVERLLPTNPSLGGKDSSRTVAALIGPPGAGKTTCLVKLAARFGLQTRRPTQILTLDTYRIAAAEQLRTYAAILGLGFQVVETVSALAQALEEYRSKDLILIDTPGFAKADMGDATDIARFLSTHREIDTHLVLPASVRTSNLKRIAERYQIFHPSKLLFTRLDETSTFGGVLNLAVATGKPLSFMSTGQQIPEDMEYADGAVLAKAILKREHMDDLLNKAEAAA
ncbi:MAG: flagellar biosynthesis protein FlhF [Acidobacteriaceae bacterium]|nr:flagellar biosynthesis protein FlhF [Acidobacteriaceae bacterium]